MPAISFEFERKLFKSDSKSLTFKGFRSLNDELCKKRIEILYNRRSNALYNIGILKHSSHAINEVDIQMIIANDFDFYLENVYDDLFQIQLEVLIKIIQAANFTNHNLAFQVILRYGEQNSNYFSLIRYLDIKLLSEENLNDIFRNSDKYSGITPIRNRKDIFVTTSGKQTIRCVTGIGIGFLSGSIFVHILHKRK